MRYLSLLFCLFLLACQPGPEEGPLPRVIVSTDINGSNPDDLH